MKPTPCSYFFLGLVILSSLLAACTPFTNDSRFFPRVAQRAYYRDDFVQKLANYHVQTILHGSTVRIILPADEIFTPGTTSIRNDKIPVLITVSDFIQLYGKPDVTITGHTDDTSSTPRSQRRSKQLAATVAAFLWAQGMPMTKLHFSGQAHQSPIASNKTVVGAAMNRRVEVSF